MLVNNCPKLFMFLFNHKDFRSLWAIVDDVEDVYALMRVF